MFVPYNSPDLLFANKSKSSASASPFVVAIKLAVIDALPAILNGCILAFVFSAANSDLCIANRPLYSLTIENNAPKIFKRIDSRGVPIFALAISAAVALVAFLNVSSLNATVFGYFVNKVTIFGLLT
jgi:yeast amino acid transporter